MENIMKVEKIASKVLIIVVLGITFYTGVLEGPIISLITNIPSKNPLLSGIMLGFFILFFRIALKIFKS